MNSTEPPRFISFKQRWEQRQTNWGMIGGIVVSVACWTGVGWLLWRATH